MTTPTVTAVPLGGVPCGRCGYPAHSMATHPNGAARIAHLDRRIPPCPAPNTPGGRP
ncbi:hypothetical protein [Amycolatopsis lexingtonensis]|uniref:hypothetical protein n=1 Tax=Amycolatopsis lexingtonensis TaxID=218822 RepID=UPI003F725855